VVRFMFAGAGIHELTFGACSRFTRVTACREGDWVTGGDPDMAKVAPST
jgi:hypothetical protein